jgi:hypothetical protein
VAINHFFTYVAPASDSISPRSGGIFHNIQKNAVAVIIDGIRIRIAARKKPAHNRYEFTTTSTGHPMSFCQSLGKDRARIVCEDRRQKTV